MTMRGKRKQLSSKFELQVNPIFIKEVVNEVLICGGDTSISKEGSNRAPKQYNLRKNARIRSPGTKS